MSQRRRMKSGRVGSRNLHRACTGNAERQFSVLSSQFSVLSSQFSVLSSQFSVLSSQFSVLSSQFSVGGTMRRWVALGFAILVGSTLLVLGQTAGSRTIAVRCGNLFDSRGDSLRKNVVIVIEGEKIKEVANAAP